MKFLVVIFLAAIATGRAEECGEERAEACVENLLSSIVGDNSDEDACRELVSSLECLKAAVEECVPDEEMEEVRLGIEQLENVFKKNCEESQETGRGRRDVNPCDTDNGGCEQECENKNGEASCSCSNGFILGSDGKTCDEMFPCLGKNGGCEQLCRFENNRKFCDCRQGYSLQSDGRSCSENSKKKRDAGDSNCFKENEDYLLECVVSSTAEALAAAAASDELDDDGKGLQCALYHTIGECFVERTAEKCGQEAADQALDELMNIPSEVKEDCESVGEIGTHDFQLLDKKRK